MLKNMNFMVCSLHIFSLKLYDSHSVYVVIFNGNLRRLLILRCCSGTYLVPAPVIACIDSHLGSLLFQLLDLLSREQALESLVHDALLFDQSDQVKLLI